MSRFSTRLWCQLLCAGGLFFAGSTTSEACLFPCLWGGWGWGGGYYGPPAYYGAPGCSPCGVGGCGFYRGYAPCACDPCGCSPCGSPCGTGCATGACGVSYFDGQPVPDSGAATGSGKTYADDPGSSTTTPPAGDDDFQKPQRNDGTTDPFPAGSNPDTTPPSGSTPDGSIAPGEPNAMRPLHELDTVVTLRMAPVRTRVRIEARYRLPHVARLTVEPHSPWLPVASERSLARK